MKLTPEHRQIIVDLKAGNSRFLSGASLQSPQASLQKLKNAAGKGPIAESDRIMLFR